VPVESKRPVGLVGQVGRVGRVGITQIQRSKRSICEISYQTHPAHQTHPTSFEAAMTDARYNPIPLTFDRLAPDEQMTRLEEFHARMMTRRTVRQYSDEDVPDVLIDRAISVAGSAPSGANMQPWQFVVVRDREVKRRIREAAEQEERAFYEKRAPKEWLDALAPLGTDWRKEFLETAPCLIVVFKVDYALQYSANGQERRIKHYYATESVGIACGLLIAALHIAGLATLTHTPSPMGFLTQILDRPKNEKPFLLIPVGLPAADAVVPHITKKPLDAIRTRV
jgi:iodotyrosine deiodinase